MTTLDIIDYAAAILEEEDQGSTITLRELRELVEEISWLDEERRVVDRLLNAIEEITR